MCSKDCLAISCSGLFCYEHAISSTLGEAAAISRNLGHMLVIQSTQTPVPLARHKDTRQVLHAQLKTVAQHR